MFRWIKQVMFSDAGAVEGTLREAVQPQLLLNEAFHEPFQFIFIAIPKTGTTSIRSQLKQVGTFLIPNPHLTALQIRDCIYPFYLLRNLEKNSKFPTRSIATDAAIREQARHSFASFFKFSMVRNPWARAVSLYFRKEGERVSKKMDFESFCEQHFYASDTCVHPTLQQNQIDWLVDDNGQCVMDYVGKLETIEEAVREVHERTNGRMKLAAQHSNRNPDSRANSYRDVHSARTKKIIYQRFERDIEHFKYLF